MAKGEGINKRTVKRLIKEINTEKLKIAHSRDELRDLLSEIEDVCDDCDEAVDNLDRAIDSLSKYL